MTNRNLYTRWGITILVSLSIHIVLLALLIVASAYLIRHPERLKQVYVQIISDDLNSAEQKPMLRFRPTKISTSLLPSAPSYSEFLPKLQTVPKSNFSSLIGGTNLVGVKSDVVLPYGEGLLRGVDNVSKIDSLSSFVYEAGKSTRFEPKIGEVAKTPSLSVLPPKVDRNASQLSALALQPAQSPLKVEIKTSLERISSHIAQVSPSKKLDLVFILDTSQSMIDNIRSTAMQLKEMAETLAEGDIDFTLGLVTFRDGFGYYLMGWDVTVSPQTKDAEKIIETLESIRCRGDERALDALMEAASKVNFRPDAQKRFIFITDEYVKGSHSGAEVLDKIKSLGITVDVIGLDEPFQRAMAEQTGGIWTPIN